MTLNGVMIADARYLRGSWASCWNHITVSNLKSTWLDTRHH